MKADHPGLLALINAAQAGAISRVVVDSLDRISRNPAQMIRVVNMLSTAGVQIRSADGSVDSASPAGGLAIGILTTFADFLESETAGRSA